MENKIEVVLQNPGFWRLVGAYIVDFMFVGGLSLFLIGPLFGILLVIIKPLANDDNPLLLIIGMCLLPYIYFSLTEGITGTSLGKKLVNIRVQANNLRWGRVPVSYLLDVILLEILCWAFVWTLSKMSWDPIALSGVFACLQGVGPLLYFPICEHFFGKTLGKKLMGLTIVQVTPQKQKEETK